MFCISDELAVIGKRGREGHVYRDGVAMAKRILRYEFMNRRPGASICNDTIESNLVKIWGLELEHLMDTLAIALVGGVDQLLRRAVGATE
jgi:hypothetical protein